MTEVRNSWVFHAAFYGALSVLAVSRAMSHLLSRRVSIHLRQHQDERPADKAIIKGFVYKLLNSLQRRFSEAKTGPAMYPLELSIADYRGIRTIRRPGFRRAFLCDCGTPTVRI